MYGSQPQSSEDDRGIGWWFRLLVAALLALRVPHLRGPLDDPHSWRQCDTVGASVDFARRGIDLLHPVVHWLGGHRTLVFEFPLPEALASLAHRAFGIDPMWDRLVALAFFSIATAYLYALARDLAGRNAARFATIAYLASPLAMFYSRAANVDFAAQAFAHAFLWHGLRALRGSTAHALAAAGLGALAALIKAPYLIPVAMPLALAFALAPSAGAFMRSALAAGVPALAFAWWRRHVDAVNAAAPDWTWLPGYYKEVNPLWWYVGDVHQRLEMAPWMKLARRMWSEVASPAGVLVSIVGIGFGGADTRRERPSARAFALAWAAGGLAYLLVFFPLNLIHNYYQVPFIAPFALLAGLGAERIASARGIRMWLGAAVLHSALVVMLVQPGQLGWYRVDHVRVEAGAAIAGRVPATDLVIAVDRGSEYSDPRLLQRADRFGWAVKPADLTAELLERLMREGARWVAWVEEPGRADLALPAMLAPRERWTVPIEYAQRRIATLHVIELPRGADPAAGVRP